MKGWVYVFSMENTAKGVVKIGCTSKDPELRAQSLSSETAAVGRCWVQYAAYCQDYVNVEKKVHESLKELRIDSREWFACTVYEAVSEIKKYATIEHENPVGPAREIRTPCPLAVFVKDNDTVNKVISSANFVVRHGFSGEEYVAVGFDLLITILKSIKIHEGHPLSIAVYDERKFNGPLSSEYRDTIRGVHYQTVIKKFSTGDVNAPKPTTEERITENMRVARAAAAARPSKNKD